MIVQVTALAGALRRPIYVINLSSPSLGDESLRALLNSAAPRSMLLLEVNTMLDLVDFLTDFFLTDFFETAV